MEIEKLLQQWSNGIRIFHFAHHLAASYYSRMNLLLGIPIIILTTIVGTTIFSSLESNPNSASRITLGILSVLAAILSALQTFLRYSELSERHRIAASKYGALRRELDEIKLTTNNQNELLKVTEKFRLKWDTIAFESPTLPQRLHDRAAEKVPPKSFEKVASTTH